MFVTNFADTDRSFADFEGRRSFNLQKFQSARIRAHVGTFAHTCTHAHTHLRTHMHTRTHALAYTHAHTHTHTHTHTTVSTFSQAISPPLVRSATKSHQNCGNLKPEVPCGSACDQHDHSTERLRLKWNNLTNNEPSNGARIHNGLTRQSNASTSERN